MARRVEQLHVVLWSEFGREQHCSGQVNRALTDSFEQERICARGPRGANAVKGCRLREVEHLGAVAIHRGAALFEI